jgi:hypothetical protein
MLIKDPKERREQAIANREKLWRFLNLHTYSDLETMRHHLDGVCLGKGKYGEVNF